MSYPSLPNFVHLSKQLRLQSQLKHEYGADNIEAILAKAGAALQAALSEIESLPVDEALARKEPSGLAEIQTLRPAGPRRLWDALDTVRYAERVEGALLGRFAGCTLGAPVEFWPIDKMASWATEIGDAFPPVDYWSEIPERHQLRYGKSRRDAYTRGGMDGVPVDDDVTYTLLGLLILEDYGPDFSVADVGAAWLKYLPMACTAEAVALANLRKGIPAEEAGSIDNPYCEWIGADIRSDPWGYLAPGWPERAAELAWRDAFLSHRRNGIYGEMFFAAAISAAFAVDDPIEALEIGLTEIPADCATARAVRWALDTASEITDYKIARETVDREFAGMSGVHTINNACLTIWGLTIGRRDFTKVISETVAMGLDNDCTAATAGSLCGAIVGAAGIPQHWTTSFNGKVLTYMNDQPEFAIGEAVQRFSAQAGRVFGNA
ncbi:MAG: ADP-ribosylglycohydrolase family protein [Lentisphaerae bacterium]|jgi:ADP-ribosylglycohydrolase|nr:ADP-ribosylglycohydrolase family protein [Lentisphaerota bacterium]MBT4815080.1 ADP-ribosylglycohydrolase family protein [Lentisphaerota bacterium]MBT5612393.1 ADP-ribosylglycohydrolase family protein [Lentisphaerota bacterium]MBT7060419.1 ADP-ribosylglycohydrolase family protein [Lentisphaerota bacterium]MBT7844727.1 ADP-ribosylglycohydrolase family protein [Lentisphaerota bacterium]